MRQLFFVSSHKIGVTVLHAENAFSLALVDPEIVFLTGENEQEKGLFDKFKLAKVPFEIIEGIDDHEKFWTLLKKISNLAKKYQTRIVHVQTNWQLAIVYFAKFFFRLNYKIIYTIHGYRNYHPAKALLARVIIGTALLLLADKILVASTFLKKKFWFVGFKSELLFLGVDRAYFSRMSSTLDNSTKRIIFPAQFRLGKNQEMLIRALHHYIRLTGDEAVELYLPGMGERLPFCKNIASELGLNGKVFFPGLLNRNEMLELYDACQFVVVPSQSETFASCIAEPIVLGKVVMSRHVGVADDIIVHGLNGFLFNSEEELVDLWVEILNDHAKIKKISEAAIKSRECFRWEVISQQYMNLCEKI